MGQTVSTEILDDVAVIRIDNPPVNALSNDVIAGLRAEVARAAGDPAARAIVVVGAGRTFVAGADIKGLEDMAWGDMSGAPDMHDTFAAIEDCPKPVVMAMHGTALGGGLELAMAGHYRVATRAARLGQPEVNLGIIPGAEGTQRLPRLVGVEKALEMCVSGRPITAEDALQAGLIEWVVEGDLVAGAVSLAREKADLSGRPPRTRDRTDKLPSAAALPAMLDTGRTLAARTKRHLEAPRAVVEAIAAAATMSFEQGCRRERELFFECARSEQAKALIYAFFAERAVSKVPGLPAEAPAPLKAVAIVGAGTMGGGIAMACANSGLDVVLTDTDQTHVDEGIATIAKNYDSSVSRGRMTADDVRARMGRITAQPGAASFQNADVVIEAAFENMAVKQEIFRRLDAGTKPGCILATNTSTLDIDAIA